MPPALASIVFAILIFGLFWLDRDRDSRVSVALWVPVIWWLLACSRSVNQWLNLGSPAQFGASDLILEGSPIDRLAYSVLEALGIIVLVSRRVVVLKLLRENVWILSFLFYCAVSILWSDYPEVSFKRWIKAVGDLVMVLVVLSDREPRAAFERLLARTTYLLVPISVLIIKYYPALGRLTHKWTYKTSYTGVALNKNILGAICLLCGLVTVWRLVSAYQDRMRSDRGRRLLAQGIVLVMILWLFWMANSMTSLACFLLGSGIVIVGSLVPNMRNNIAAMHSMIGAVMVVTTSVLFFNISPDVLETIGRDPTLTDRTEIWGLLLSLVGNPLVGTGYESFWLGPRLERIWSIYSWQPNEAHNGYIEIFVNLGWVGVGLLAVVLVAGYRRVIAAFRVNPRAGIIMVAYFVVGVIYNFTEASFFRMMTPVWIYLLLGMTGAMVLSKLGKDSEVQRSRKAFSVND